MKFTLITGVAGTTGSSILDILSKSEEVVSGERKVVGVDNLFRGVMSNISDHLDKDYFDFIEDDFRSLTADYLKKFDEIYHMAAVVPTKYFYERPDLTYEINCRGTIDLFNKAVEAGVKRFIEGSSSEIYGHIVDFPCKEQYASKFDSVEFSTRWSYAEGKLLVEHYLNHFADKMERVCHLRFANTYGVRDMDDNHIIPYLINRVINNGNIHINENAEGFFRTFLNNRDSSRACVELMSKGENGVAYNVGSSEEVSIESLLERVKIIHETITGKAYTGTVFRDVSRRGDPCRRVLDISRLVECTGFRPEISLSSGIAEMIRFACRKKGEFV